MRVIENYPNIYNIQIYLPNISTGQNLAWDQVPHWGKKEKNRRGRKKKWRGRGEVV